MMKARLGFKVVSWSVQTETDLFLSHITKYKRIHDFFQVPEPSHQTVFLAGKRKYFFIFQSNKERDMRQLNTLPVGELIPTKPAFPLLNFLLS